MTTFATAPFSTTLRARSAVKATHSVVLAVDAGLASDRDGDHLLAELARIFSISEDAYGCTHHERSDNPRVVITLDVADDDLNPDSALEWAAEIAAVLGGRLPHSAIGVTYGADSNGPAALVQAARRAADAHLQGTSGRLVLFPGHDELSGRISVGELLDLSAIDAVRVMGSPSEQLPDLGKLVETREFVRPQWRSGVLTLELAPIVGGFLTPFEDPKPTPCCVRHA